MFCSCKDDSTTGIANAILHTGTDRCIFEDIDGLVARLIKQGAQLVGEIVQYGNAYWLCYIRGTEGLLIGLAEELKK